jgi:CheY-like chemotaxis protein
MANTLYIALADDDIEDQDMLASRFLKKYPAIIFKFFHNGEQIIRYLEGCPSSELPFILILDYKMPIFTGADVLKILRQDRRYDAIHKIVWSTSGNHQYVSECLQNGAEKYFTKPNDTRELDSIITQLSDILV